MSADNILQIDPCDFQDKADVIYSQQVYKYILFKDYMVGKEINFTKIKNLERLLSIKKYDECLFEEGFVELLDCKIKKILNELQK